jgi:hypothetical protein
MHCVVQTPDFLADAKDAGIEEVERNEIVSYLSANPTAGVVIKGTGGARKVRFAGRGKGKSGGYRVITFYAAEDIPIFLLNVFSKGDKVDLSQSERNALRKELANVVDDYRQGVHLYVASG